MVSDQNGKSTHDFYYNHEFSVLKMYSCFILMIATKNSTVFVALIIKYISLVDYKVLQSESSHYEQSKQNM